jgi:hypothetical protein
MGSKQEKAQKIMNDIRRILIDDWDPIGIKGFGPDDEYDSYIGTLYRLLSQKPSEDEIMDHLYSLETDQMGLSIKDKGVLRAVAKKLLGVNVLLYE